MSSDQALPIKRLSCLEACKSKDGGRQVLQSTMTQLFTWLDSWTNSEKQVTDLGPMHHMPSRTEEGKRANSTKLLAIQYISWRARITPAHDKVRGQVRTFKRRFSHDQHIMCQEFPGTGIHASQEQVT
ncbi:hypothetical protein BM449_01540 [Synechococcus sp. SynAce01]|nr:hypothetical protein BM449_01540 [Synechococcus sp. SynAce01]